MLEIINYRIKFRIAHFDIHFRDIFMKKLTNPLVRESAKTYNFYAMHKFDFFTLWFFKAHSQKENFIF